MDDVVWVVVKLDREFVLDALVVHADEAEAVRTARRWAREEVPDTGWRVEAVRVGFGEEWTEGDVVWSNEEDA